MLANKPAGYGLIAIALHWISAGGVIWLYFLGENIEHAKEDGLPREAVQDMINFHQSVGTLFFVFLIAFVFQYLAQKRPAPIAQAQYLQLLSKMVQRLWILLIAVQALTGPLLRWTAGRPNVVFDWFEIPSPFPERINWLHEALEWVHATAPNLFWPLIVLHVLGVVKHVVKDRDETLIRMLRPVKGSAQTQTLMSDEKSSS